MELRVSELAQAAGVGIDTVRFYQARGLLSAPERRGRFAIYSAEHLERLRRIRSLLDSGFSLAQIRQLLASDESAAAASPMGVSKPSDGEARSLLDALADRSVGEGTLSRSELAGETGVPEALIASSIQAGLITSIEINGEARFPRSDLAMLQAALEILGMGLPLDKLIELGAEHAAHVDRLVERAIDLFDDAIRKPQGDDEEKVRQIFERLLPRVTQVVALHFQRTVVTRALARLRASGDARALEGALEMAQAARLEVQWR